MKDPIPFNSYCSKTWWALSLKERFLDSITTVGSSFSDSMLFQCSNFFFVRTKVFFLCSFTTVKHHCCKSIRWATDPAPPPQKTKNILAPLLSHCLGTFGVSLLCETLLAVHTSLLASKSFTTSILATIIVQILNECKTEDNPGGNSGALCQSLTHIFKQFLN